MKKTLFLSALCALTFTAQAQLVQKNELAVVYYMPKTQVMIDINYVEETMKPGPFYMFAEEMLGATDIIEQAGKKYSIESVDIFSRTIADYDRAYKVTADETCAMQLLTLTDKGILRGFNIVPEQITNPRNKQRQPETKPNEPSRLMPLFEEQIRANTLRETAMGVAKQIYRIRETRLYILSGEIEKAPSDKRTLEMMLDKLAEQEKELTDLFIGSRIITKHTKHITYYPTKTEHRKLFYFSEENGIVEDETNTPVIIDVLAHKQVMGAPNGTPNKKAPQPSQIYFNLPGSCDINILYKDELIAEKSMPIAQFGVAVPLAMNLFTKGELPKIVFNPYTGNIESISK